MNTSTFYKLIGILLLAICVIACSVEITEPDINPPARFYDQQGKSLVNGLAACGYCHGETQQPGAALSGGMLLYDGHGEVAAANITPAKSGLKDWSALQFLKFFRSRATPNGSKISDQVHSGFEWMSESDVLAIYSYLRSLRPVEKDIDRRSIGFISRNTTGFFDSNEEVAGYVPDIDKSYRAEYGEYLADHVARCSSCHNSPQTLFGSVRYFGGGVLIKNEFGEMIAPNISSSPSHGIGKWGEEDLIKYLNTGIRPGGRKVDNRFCPVGFFSRAQPEDIISLAKYIKAVPPVEAE